MSLTDTKVKNARPSEKAVKLADGFSLYRFKILAVRLSLQWQTEGVFYWGLPCGFSCWCQTTPWRGQKAAGSGDWPERKKQADEKILQEKRDKTRSFRVVAKSWCTIILPMILTEIFSPAPEIYLPFPLPASDCLYQPFSQNISRLKFILLPALNLYGVMSQNYLPSACQFFTFNQTRYIAIAVRSQHLTCAITDKVAPCRSKVGIRSKLQRFVVFVSKQTRNLISPFDKPIAPR